MKLLISLFILSSVTFGQVKFGDVDTLYNHNKLTYDYETGEWMVHYEGQHYNVNEFFNKIAELEARIKELEDKQGAIFFYSDSISPAFIDPMFILPYDYYQKSLKNIKLE